jgi:hypothetical protein
MATRSTIALEFADGTVQAVYCHWDGYLGNNGQILLKHYSDPFKLRDLIDLGGFSSLCESVEGTAEGAYTQRGEARVIQKFKDIEDYYANVYGEEYDYILSKNWEGKAQWYVRHYGTQENWIPLEMAIMNEQDETAQEEA